MSDDIVNTSGLMQGEVTIGVSPELLHFSVPNPGL